MRINKVDNREKELDEQLEKIRKANLIYFFEPFEWHKRGAEILRKKNMVAVVASNKIGKTCFGATTVISWSLGYEPWNEVGKNYPDAVCVDGIYFKPSSLGKKPPVKIKIVGLDWKEHIGETIVPELKKWAPEGLYTTKKNEQGVEHDWEWFNGSEFKIMCNTQDDKVFESFLCDGVWTDEPLEKKKFAGISRGVFMVNGKILFTFTPLDAAWVLDDIVLSDRGDIGIIDHLNLKANEHTYSDECEKLKNLGLSDKQIERYFDLLFYEDKAKKKYVIDKGKAAEEFIKGIAPIEKHEDIYALRMLRFVKDIDPKEVAPRVFGEFKALIGRILKDFNKEVHLIDEIKPDKVPTDWIIVPMIDWHLSKPIAISYWAIDKHNLHYCIKETWENLSADEVADEIIRLRGQFSWNISEVFIDPFAKGDTEYMKNRAGTNLKDSYSIIEEKLADYDMSLVVASKDKDSGIKNIEEGLRGVGGRPTTFLCRNLKRHIWETERWIYGDDDKPAKENDDMMENWYRFTLTGIQYEDNIIEKYIQPSLRKRSLSCSEGAWMGI